MLPEAPCADPLVGCNDSIFGSGGSASSSSSAPSSYNTFSSSSSSSSSRSAFSFSARSSSSSNALDRYLGSGSSVLKAKKNYFALYTLKAQNTGNSAVQAVKVTHGPLPFNLTFEPSKSTPQCVQVQKNIECTVDMAAGETKDLTIGYKTTSYFGCAYARFLQTAKATVASGSSPVVVSVSCRVEAVDLQASSSSSFSSSSSSSSLFSNTGSGFTVGSFPGTVAGSGSTYVAGTGYPSTGYKGYKPYTVMPRTGAGDYFGSLTSSDFVLIPRSAENEPVFALPLLFLSVLSMVILVKMAKTSLFRK